MLNDGRLASGSENSLIIIYNKNTYQPELIIKQHKYDIYCIIQLSSGELASCSYDQTIKIYNIKETQYKVIQTLNYHDNIVWKILKLKNNILVSASNDSSIIFYIKDNKEYKKDYKISTNASCSSIIQTKDNEICYSESDNNTICFYNILEGKIIASISKVNKYNDKREWYIMIR